MYSIKRKHINIFHKEWSGEYLGKFDLVSENDKKAKEWANELMLKLTWRINQQSWRETLNKEVLNQKKLLWINYNGSSYEALAKAIGNFIDSWILFNKDGELKSDWKQKTLDTFTQSIWLKNINVESWILDFKLELNRFEELAKTNQNVKKQLSILEATETISFWKTVILENLFWKYGESWRVAILNSLKWAEKWESMKIVGYDSSEWYSVMSIEAYQKKALNSPETIHASVVKGAIMIEEKLNLWVFNEETWWAIWAYCEKRWWNSRLCNNSEVKTFLGKKYVSYQKIQQERINKALWEEWQKRYKEEPKFAAIINKRTYISNETGIMNMKSAMIWFKDSTDPDGIINWFKDTVETLTNEINTLKQEKWKKESEISKRKIDSLIELWEKHKISLTLIPENLLKNKVQSWRLDEINNFLPKLIEIRNNQKTLRQ